MATAAQKNQERVREIIATMLGPLATGDLRVDFARAELLAEQGLGTEAWAEVVRLMPIAKFPERELPPNRLSGAVDPDDPQFWEQQTAAVRDYLDTVDADQQRREMLDRAGERDYLERIFGGSGDTQTAERGGTQPAPAPSTGDPLEARAGAGAFDDAPTTSGGTTSAGSQGSGAAGGGTPSPTPTGGGAPSTATDGADGTLNRVPEGAQVWKVGSVHYLAYKVPGTGIEAIWQVEDDERLEAIFGTTTPPIDLQLTEAQLKARAPWRGGLSRELSDLHVGADPWQQFISDFEEAAELRPWLRDPSYQAINAIAYLEGRAPTTDELARTDWWNEHTEDERAWMESSATAGRAEVERRMRDAKEITAEALRNAGTDNAPQAVIDYIAMQRLTGKWSQEKANQQVRRLTDPSAPGNLDPGVWAAWRGDANTAKQARAIAEGRPSVVALIRRMFEDAQVGIGTEDEPEGDRLLRIADEVLSGQRTLDDVQRSIDIMRSREGQTLPGLDTTRAQEDTVRDLAQQWLGPKMGGMTDDEVDHWAGILRNNPDGQTELVEHLMSENAALFSAYDTPMPWEARIGPIRRTATSIWGQPVEDDSLLVNLANMRDYVEAEKVLRREGWQRGIQKVQNDMMSGLSSTALGEQVVRSTV